MEPASCKMCIYFEEEYCMRRKKAAGDIFLCEHYVDSSASLSLSDLITEMAQMLIKEEGC